MGTEKSNNVNNWDMAIRFLDQLVAEGFVKDCLDTDEEDEWEVQDAIEEFLNKLFPDKIAEK